LATASKFVQRALPKTVLGKKSHTESCMPCCQLSSQLQMTVRRGAEALKSSLWMKDRQSLQKISAPLAFMKIYRRTPLSSRSISMDSTFKGGFVHKLSEENFPRLVLSVPGAKSHNSLFRWRREEKNLWAHQSCSDVRWKINGNGKSSRGKLIMDYHLFTEKSSAYHLCIETNRITKDSIFGNKKTFTASLFLCIL
jgi:hypothetical protein